MSQEMFTNEEAKAFLQNSWEIKNVGERLKNDRKNLLDEIVTVILAKVPFQSITLMATPLLERGRPLFENIKKDCMTGIGGLCYSINGFTYGLLKGLGFSVRRARSTVTSTVSSPNNHVIIFVSGVQKEGDLYLVDCGTGFPIFRAVPLDFDQESPVYQDGFLEYKYVRHDGKILRMHGKGDMMKRNNPPVDGLDFIVGRWRRFYSFTLDQGGIEHDCDEHYSATVDLTPFPSSPRAILFPEKRLIAVANNRLIVETKEGKLEITVSKSDKEIEKCFCNNFPLLQHNSVRLALVEWHRVSK